MSEEKAFVNKAQKVTLSNGEEVELPRLTLGRIMAVTESVGRLMDAIKAKAPKLASMFSEQRGEDDMSLGGEVVQALPSVLPVILGEVVEVISAYTNIDKGKIADEWDAEDLVNVATPFFVAIFAQGTHLVNPLVKMFPKRQNVNSN